MNLGLVTSFIIAGILMIAMVMLNLRMSTSSAELTLSQITRTHIGNVSDMLNDDIPNMGYNVDSNVSPAILEADSSRIRFYRNINDYQNPSGEFEPQIITWELLDDDPDFTYRNPNHRTLVRTVSYENGTEDVTPIRTGVVRFELKYLEAQGGDVNDDANLMPTPVTGSDLNNIRQIYMELEMQSDEPIYTRAHSDGRYIRSVYEKRFSPRNLE